MPQSSFHNRRASVIGAGPNGLAAAIVLAQAGLEVEVYEAERTVGGAARTLELTLPGFRHDFGSAVHPMAIGSPFFSTLPLRDYGLEWVQPPAPLAHPFDDGTAAILEQDFAASTLGEDCESWRRLFQPVSAHWSELASAVLRPVLSIPRHPLLLARFGIHGLLPASTLTRTRFHTVQARALFAGLAAHSFLSLDHPGSAAFGLLLGAAAHSVGWPIPRGGAQSLADALAAHLIQLGGRIHTASPIRRLSDLPSSDLTLCDISPRQLLTLAGESQLTPSDRRRLAGYRYGPAAFKVDYALNSPIPWSAPACARAATVHLGGTFGDIAASESAMASGRLAERPFVLLVQPTLFDTTRAPAGKHIAWAYCHVPNGFARSPNAAELEALALDRLEAQIERFAPGFRSTVLARHVSPPAVLESMDANLIGGDIVGGANTLRQIIFRPTSRGYRTSATGLFLCSASTPPGGGVHGMCGYHAANLALKSL